MTPSPARRAVGRAAIDGWRFGGRARAKLFSLAVAGSFESFGGRTVLAPPIRISGERRIRVGDDVFVGAGCWLQVLDGAVTGVDEHGHAVAISLGSGTSIAGVCTLSAARSIEVGRDVSFGRGVYVADHAHAYDDPDVPVQHQGVSGIAPVSIGDGAWIGEHVVVLPGVRVGRGAVISANAVVSKDVPDHCLAAGAPARVLRRFGPAANAETAA